MRNIELEIKDGFRYILSKYFDICLIDNLSRKEITKLFPSRKDGIYYINKFINHLKINHNLDLKEYLKIYYDFNWPFCSEAKEFFGFKVSGFGIKIANYISGYVTKENCETFRKGCERLSKERMGEGNPMYGKDTWNKGLTKETNETLRKMGEKGLGRKASPETCEKIRQSLLNHPNKNRHNMPHSPETVEKMRVITAKRMAEGGFKKTRTSIHIKMLDLLNSLPLKSKFEEEYQVKYFCVDFAFPDVKVAIETDGDYFHCNPQFYPNGPVSVVQRRNFGRDKAKNKYLGDRGWVILRFWECDINSGVFKENLICKLKELDLLEDSA